MTRSLAELMGRTGPSTASSDTWLPSSPVALVTGQAPHSVTAPLGVLHPAAGEARAEAAGKRRAGG